MAKDPNLPKRFFRCGHEPDVKNKVNFYCFIQYYQAIMTFLDNNLEQKEILLDSQFEKLLKEGFKILTSAQFLYYLLSRQLHTTSAHEIWILFCGKPFRFSLREFAVATGLTCSIPSPITEGEEGRNEEEDDNRACEGDEDEAVDGDDSEEEAKRIPYWSELFENENEVTPKWISEKLKSKKIDATKRLKLACLLLVDALLLPTSADPKIIDSHVRMLRDLNMFLQHPWGKDCFAMTMKSIKARKQDGMCQKTMAIQGFIHGLQLIALSCIPEITTFATSDSNNPKKEIIMNAESDNDYDDGKFVKALKINMNLLKILDTKRHVISFFKVNYLVV